MQLYTTLHSDAITSKGAWLLRRGDGARGPGERRNLDLSYVVTIKFTVETSQNFVAFSEYMDCMWKLEVPKFAGPPTALAQVTANVFVFTQKIEFYFVLEKKKGSWQT